MTEFRTPKVEEYLRESTFERRAHILTKDDAYVMKSSVVHVPYVEVTGRSLPDYSELGVVMWVDYMRYRRTDEGDDSSRPSVSLRQVGDVGFAIAERDFYRVDDIVTENLETSYLKGWLERYCSKRGRDSFGALRYPVIDPLAVLQRHIKRAS